jgi:hypothetical protein
MIFWTSFRHLIFSCANLADVDLALYVELNSFPLSSGIFSNNMTLIIGIPILQQLLGICVHLIIFFSEDN